LIAEQLTRPSLQADVISLLIEADESRSEALSALLWRAGFRIHGDLGRITRLLRSPTVTEVIRYFAAGTVENPELFARSLERASPAAPEDFPEVYATATYAVGRPQTMRWISANPDRVISSETWLTALPGLGGVTKSVPLAEEALNHLIQRRARISRDLTMYVQLNPWFSRRFATRYRRRMKGKRIRVYERAATARGWSHARTILMTQLPDDWQALLKRGEGRPLDAWSHQLLAGYTETIARFSPDGVPPVLAPLYTIAKAGLGSGSTTSELVEGWDVLPSEVQFKARLLLGINHDLIVEPDHSQQEANSLAVAAGELGSDRAAWQAFAAVAYEQDRGFSAAAADLLRR
jgi:hypothetical protein